MKNIRSSRQKLVLFVLVVLLLVVTGCSVTFTVKVPGARPAFEYDRRKIEIKYKPYPSPSSVVVMIPGYFANYGTKSYTNIRNVYIEVLYKRHWDNNWRSLGGQWMGYDWSLYNKVVHPTPSGRHFERYGVPWEFECWFSAAGFPDPKTIKEWKIEISFDYDEIKDKTIIVM